MKTAILYSGHARTFARTCANHRWMLYRHFGDFEIFASLVDDKDGGDMAALLRHYYPGRAHVELVSQPEHIPLPAGCPDESTYRQGQPFTHEPYWISVPPQGVLKQLWHLQRVWTFFEEGDLRTHDRIVRVRPDLWFHSLRPPFTPAPNDAFVPWWGRFGGQNDRFAIMGWRAADRYFTTFDRLDESIKAGAPLHPESLISHSLESAVVRRIEVEFSTLRNNGEMRPPEITAADIAAGIG